MSPAPYTFAYQLRRFARSVDIVDDSIFDRVRQLVYKYVRSELGAAYFELMREQDIGGSPGLRMFWSSEDRDHSWLVNQADGSFSNPITMAFGQQQPLWIVDADKAPLADSASLRDEWSHSDQLTTYQPVADNESIRTLVVLPLRRKRLLGVCYFECGDYIGITDVARMELKLLAESIAILLELYETNRSQSEMTSSAIFELQESLEAAKFPKLTKPHFFVAFSNRADIHVRSAIQRVLHEASDRLEFTDWTKINEAGNINAQIAKEIVRARFGICYLSEPAKEPADGVEYTDNPNVIFEAGMLHAHTATSDAGDGAEPAGWIPIREKASPPPPFDFAAERIVYVPRLPGGSVEEDLLLETLRARITSLLGPG